MSQFVPPSDILKTAGTWTDTVGGVADTYMQRRTAADATAILVIPIAIPQNSVAQKGERGDVLTVPEWTDADNWAVACDPAIAPAIYVGYRFGRVPEVFIAGDNQSPAVFMNDEHRLKVRFFLTVWVNDFRPLHKENV